MSVVSCHSELSVQSVQRRRACIRFHFRSAGVERPEWETEWEFWNKCDLFYSVFFLFIFISSTQSPIEIVEDRAHSSEPVAEDVHKLQDSQLWWTRESGNASPQHYEGQRVKCATCTNNWIDGEKVDAACVSSASPSFSISRVASQSVFAAE